LRAAGSGYGAPSNGPNQENFIMRRLNVVALTAMLASTMVGVLQGGCTSKNGAGVDGRGERTQAAAQEAAALVGGENLDFEAGMGGGGFPAGWSGGGAGYSMGVDNEHPLMGRGSARIRCDDGNAPGGRGWGTLTKCVEGGAWKGKRVRYSGSIRTEGVQSAGLWMRVDGGKKELSFDNMDDRSVKGTTESRRYSVVLDVAQNATGVCFGVLHVGGGTVWADDLTFEVVDAQTAVTGAWVGGGGGSEGLPRNLDFEGGSAGTGGPDGWGGGGEGYVLGVENANARAGAGSGRIANTTGRAGEEGFGTLTQCVNVDGWKGKRVRYSGWLKTAGATGTGAGLWLRIDGVDMAIVGFDNMMNRAVRGDADWKAHAMVLDVPKEATAACFGFLIAGPGTVWGDDLKFEIVGNDVPVTNMTE